MIRAVVAVALASPFSIVSITPAAAQERSSDNAVTQAGDAFGFSVGRETIGVYSPSNTRGFSPAQAGNIRLEGLYFDDLYDPSSALTNSVSIQVGLASQGYPFAAPSGIVNIALRRPAEKAGASIVANTDTFGTVGIEVDGSQPLSGTVLLGYGITAGQTHYADGTRNSITHSEALIARWRPTDTIEIMPFWSVGRDQNDQAGVFYLTAGKYLPKSPPYDHFDGPKWSGITYVGGDQGILTTFTPSKLWTIRAGLFRSVYDLRSAYTNLLVDEKPDGSGQRITEADPRNVARSWSGEVRIARSMADGPRLHTLQLSVRGRDTRREFGGSSEADLGPGGVGVSVTAPKPTFNFGPLSTDHVTQSNIGVTYDGRWKDVGEISVSVGRSNYRDNIRIVGVQPALTHAQPWIGDTTLAIQITSGLVAYAGYARGLEQSGVAPATAANRNQPLPAILTSQRDAGLRWAVTGDIKLIAGVFDLRRPSFNFSLANIYTQVGTTRSRGAELSVNGHITKRLTVVAGGYVLDPRVDPDVGTAVAIGKRPAGLPSHYAALNLNWETPIKGISLDLSASHRGRTPSTVDDAVYLPSHLELEPGIRYGFRLAGHSATARIQITNLLDDRYFGTNGPGIYVAMPRRYVSGYVAADL
jgi:iron complex outermembrane receptor protein